MKKIAKVFEIIGFFIAIVSMCFDVSEKPILSIPILSGWIVFFIGTKVEGGWQDAEEIVEEHTPYVEDDDTDDGITYITYDNHESENYMCK